MENRLNKVTRMRIPRTLYGEIAKRAQADERCINKQIIYLVRMGILWADTHPPTEAQQVTPMTG